MVKESPLTSRQPGRVSGVVSALTLFAVFAVLSFLKYLSLHSAVFDLGVYLSNIYAVSQAGEWWRMFNGHIQPLLPLFGGACDLGPAPAAPFILLGIQAFFLALPIVWIAPRFGFTATLAYALYFPVWYLALFDFHPDFLAAPLLFGFFLLARAEKIWGAFVLGLALALIKEPYALQTAACGVYLLCVSRRRLPGMLLVLIGCASFYAAARYALPFFTADAGVGLSGGAFSWLGAGPLDMAGHVLSHPLEVLGKTLGNPQKLKYLACLLGALAFLPLVRPLALVTALPWLALSLLSDSPNYYGLGNHYSAGVAIPALFAFCLALGPARGAWGRYGLPPALFTLLVTAVLVAGHVLLSPSPVSRLFWRGDVWSYDLAAYQPTARDADIITAIHDYVPADPAVPVAAQNTLNWGALSRRLHYNSFPLGVFKPHKVQVMTLDDLASFRHFAATGEKPALRQISWTAAYVLLDLKRPWFLVDQGCDWRGACNDHLAASAFLEAVEKAKTLYDTVYERDGFMILRRKGLAP
mgnify:FL=1